MATFFQCSQCAEPVIDVVTRTGAESGGRALQSNVERDQEPLARNHWVVARSDFSPPSAMGVVNMMMSVLTFKKGNHPLQHWTSKN